MRKSIFFFFVVVLNSACLSPSFSAKVHPPPLERWFASGDGCNSPKVFYVKLLQDITNPLGRMATSRGCVVVIFCRVSPTHLDGNGNSLSESFSLEKKFFSFSFFFSREKEFWKRLSFPSKWVGHILLKFDTKNTKMVAILSPEGTAPPEGGWAFPRRGSAHFSHNLHQRLWVFC